MKFNYNLYIIINIFVTVGTYRIRSAEVIKQVVETALQAGYRMFGMLRLQS